jgi:hypothetical protein
MTLPTFGTWTDKAPTTRAEQFRQRLFPLDPDFEDKIPRLAPAFLWIFVKYYSLYIKERLVLPRVVVDYTENYWKNNDLFAQFLGEMVREVVIRDEQGRPVKDPNAKLTLSEIYGAFTAWYKSAAPGNRIPDRTKVLSELTTRWKTPPRRGYWYGVRLLDDDEELVDNQEATQEQDTLEPSGEAMALGSPRDVLSQEQRQYLNLLSPHPEGAEGWSPAPLTAKRETLPAPVSSPQWTETEISRSQSGPVPPSQPVAFQPPAPQAENSPVYFQPTASPTAFMSNYQNQWRPNSPLVLSESSEEEISDSEYTF